MEYFAADISPVENAKARQSPDRSESSPEAASQAVRPNLLQAEVARGTNESKGSDLRASSPSAYLHASKLIR